jgi:hypothetical protein
LSRFAAIKSTRPSQAQTEAPAELAAGGKAAARTGKKVVSGHFSVEMSRALHLLAIENGTSLQALMGEAFDDLMRKYGKHPFGER